MKVASNTDAYVQYEYLDAKIAASGSSVSKTGQGLVAGLRTLLAPKVEGDFHAGYAKLKDTDSTSSVGVGLGYRAADNFIVRAGYSSAQDTKTYTVTLNYAF